MRRQGEPEWAVGVVSFCFLAPIASDRLFWSISSVTQHFKRLEEEKVQLSRHPLLTPSSGQRENKVHPYNTTARRRACWQGRALPAPTAAAISQTTSTETPQHWCSRNRGAAHAHHCLCSCSCVPCVENVLIKTNDIFLLLKVTNEYKS